MDRGQLVLLACRSGNAFATRIANAIDGTDLTPCDEVVFANREVKVVISRNIRGGDVYIVQNVDDPLRPDVSVNDNLMAVVTAIHAARESDAEKVTAVLPAFPYARQDRKKGREGITAKVVARLLEIAGADRVITLDIHAEAIAGFFSWAKLENLHASGTVLDAIRATRAVDGLMVCAADVGSAERGRTYSRKLGCDLAILDKARLTSHKSAIESMRLVGDVDGKDVLVPDDMVATGGTLLRACEVLRENGAKSVLIAVSLPFFSEDAAERFDAAYAKGLFTAVIGTDAVFRGAEFLKAHPWYEEVTVAPLFAKAITNINKKGSVSELMR